MLLALLSLWEGEGIPPTTTLRPGRVYKGRYPYFKPRKKPYWEDDISDEDDALDILGIEL